MTVLIRFDIDNAAFKDDAEDYDMEAVAATVRKVAGAMATADATDRDSPIIAKHKNIVDANGNIVGTWCIKEAELL